MATLRTTITLRDRMSNTLVKIASNTQRVSNNFETLNNSMNKASGNADLLNNKLGRLITTYGSLYGLGKIVQLSDELALSASRLDIVLEKMGESSKTVAELQAQVYASAQSSRGSYVEMQKSVAKLGILAGDAFENSAEMATFVGQLNKMFVLSGAGSREQSMAMYQLTQAMGSGRLQGDEYRSIIENAGYLAQAIENYMREVEGATGSMKDWASQGLLTARVIKNAVAYAQEETNKRFETMSYTWAQVWQKIKNTAVKMAEPILKIINLIANNWDLIRPIVLGVAGAMAIYYASVLLPTIAATIAKTAADWAATAAIIAMTFAQQGLNAALALCPLSWILMAIVALIALFYAAVAAINKFAGTSVSATGIIAGTFRALLTFIGNFVIMFQNWFADLVNFIANCFQNPVAAIKRLFLNLGVTVLGVIEKIAEGIEALINKIPGVEIDITSRLTGLKNALQARSDEIKDEAGLVDIMEKWQYGSLVDAFGKGYDWGANLGSGLSDSLGLNMDLGKDIANTAANTAQTANAVSSSAEDLKWLRMLAEREAINKFTTAEIKVDMGGIQNVVNSNMDLDGVVTYLEETLTEKMASVAEGTHY